jgi:hypothetical protein
MLFSQPLTEFPEELNSSGSGDKRVETVLISHELDML